MNPFRQALLILDHGKRWIQGDYNRIDDNVNYYCVMGAICATQNQDYDETWEQRWYQDAHKMLNGIIAEQYPNHEENVENFNDDPRITWQDVEVVLEKAAVKYDEKVYLQNDSRLC